MRIRYHLIILLMAFGFMSNAQVAEIIPINGTEFCAGYEAENFVHICFMGPPIPMSSYFRLEFKWIVKHENGTWIWRTRFFDRDVPLPFEGQYEIEAWVSYYFGSNSRPFASFRSNRIYINASDCTE